MMHLPTCTCIQHQNMKLIIIAQSVFMVSVEGTTTHYTFTCKRQWVAVQVCDDALAHPPVYPTSKVLCKSLMMITVETHKCNAGNDAQYI
jgi:hypothetical protein